MLDYRVVIVAGDVSVKEESNPGNQVPDVNVLLDIDAFTASITTSRWAEDDYAESVAPLLRGLRRAGFMVDEEDGDLSTEGFTGNGGAFTVRHLVPTIPVHDSLWEVFGVADMPTTDECSVIARTTMLAITDTLGDVSVMATV